MNILINVLILIVNTINISLIISTIDEGKGDKSLIAIGMIFICLWWMYSDKRKKMIETVRILFGNKELVSNYENSYSTLVSMGLFYVLYHTVVVLNIILM